jgi:predicted 2-oxoglutarate/Fe(II)-dependent dioxygenase YbiX
VKWNEVARSGAVELLEDMNDSSDDQDSINNPVEDVVANKNLSSSVPLPQECITIVDDIEENDEYYEDSDGNMVKHPGKGFTKWMNVTLSMDPTIPLTPIDVGAGDLSSEGKDF